MLTTNCVHSLINRTRLGLGFCKKELAAAKTKHFLYSKIDHNYEHTGMQCMVALIIDKFCSCYATKTFKRFRSCLSWGTISSDFFLEYFRFWNWKLLVLIVCWASVNAEGHQTDLRQDFLPYWPSPPLIEIITITTANTTNTTLPTFVCNVYLVKSVSLLKLFVPQTQGDTWFDGVDAHP